MWPFSLFYKPQQPRTSTIITIPGSKVRISLCEARYFTQKEMAKSLEALCVLSYVLNSIEFEQRIEQAYFSTTQLSNKQIYALILKSNEQGDGYGIAGTLGMDHGDDGEMDLVLSMYMSRFSKVVGYTLPESVRVFINRKFFSYYKAWNVAGNWSHEWLHNLGFDHSSASDSQSVPYLVGDIVAELGEKYYVEAMAAKRPLIETHIRTGALL